MDQCIYSVCWKDYSVCLFVYFIDEDSTFVNIEIKHLNYYYLLKVIVALWFCYNLRTLCTCSKLITI